MSGHSKWASIKHKKALVDAKRGKVFTKFIREITVAAKIGGGDPATNPRLRTAIESAKSANMPADNIERAVKKGSGELEGVSYEEVFYEGYGPEGVAMYVRCLSDNKNRAASEIRSIFTRKNGNMAGAGSVGWLFEKKGFFVVDQSAAKEDELMQVALDAGAEDLSKDGEKFEILTDPHDFDKVKKALDEVKIKCDMAEMSMIPKTTVSVGAESARLVLGLIDALEDHDDVQNVYTNCDFPPDVLKEI